MIKWGEYSNLGKKLSNTENKVKMTYLGNKHTTNYPSRVELLNHLP